MTASFWRVEAPFTSPFVTILGRVFYDYRSFAFTVFLNQGQTVTGAGGRVLNREVSVEIKYLEPMVIHRINSDRNGMMQMVLRILLEIKFLS
jgi:hypothetical protein